MKKEYIAGREYVSCTGFSLGNCGGGREWRLGCGAAAVGEGERDNEYALDACRQRWICFSLGIGSHGEHGHSVDCIVCVKDTV